MRKTAATFSSIVIAILTINFAAQACHAHFAWLAKDEMGRAVLFFSEDPKEREYKIPDCLEAAKITAIRADGTSKTIEHRTLEKDGFAGRVSVQPSPKNAALQSVVTYGIYHGTLLRYYVKHIPSNSIATTPVSEGNFQVQVTFDGKVLGNANITLEDSAGNKTKKVTDKNGVVVFPRNNEKLKLGHHPVKVTIDGKSNAVVKNPHPLKLDATATVTEHGIDLTVLWEGKPLEGASVTMLDPSGEKAMQISDKRGLASFASIKAGLVGFLINHTVKPAAGEFNGEKYESETNYCTVTMNYKKAGSGHHHKKAPAKKVSVKTDFPALPIGVASFGGTVCGDYLYVYSGHTGTAHDHSRDNLAKQFARIKINAENKAWETLPISEPLQGLPLVATGGKVYRVGGLDAHNAKGEDEDLHSVDSFSQFDPETKTWTKLPSLPECRSSHDAVVIDGVIYVAGGWTLNGKDGEKKWLSTAWSYDTNADDAKWIALPEQPFKRRALALTHWDGKVVVVCGMDSENHVSQLIDCYDPKTKTWSKLANYPGNDVHGFGTSAWNLGGKVYGNGNEGNVYCMSDDGKSWTKVAKVQQPRFFHRLLPSGKNELIAVAGTSFTAGHLNNTERIQLPTDSK